MKTQKNILLVINPIAGGTDKRPIIKAFKEQVAAQNKESHVYETTGKNDKEAI